MTVGGPVNPIHPFLNDSNAYDELSVYRTGYVGCTLKGGDKHDKRKKDRHLCVLV